MDGTAATAGRRPDAIAPDGSEIFYRVGNAERASMVEVRLPAGAVSRPVRHRTVEEIWYFLDGTGRVWLQPPGEPGQVRGVGPASVVVIPTGWAFQFAAEPGSDLRFACFTSPPWPGATEAEPVASGGL